MDFIPRRSPRLAAKRQTIPTYPTPPTVYTKNECREQTCELQSCNPLQFDGNRQSAREIVNTFRGSIDENMKRRFTTIMKQYLNDIDRAADPTSKVVIATCLSRFLFQHPYVLAASECLRTTVRTKMQELQKARSHNGPIDAAFQQAIATILYVVS